MVRGAGRERNKADESRRGAFARITGAHGK
jgi:hypothetical protein